jgi:DNA-binding CsgD family transcriptional regulator
MTTLKKQAEGPRRTDPIDDRIRTLTRREAEVLEHLIKGLSNEQIALALFRSPKTIDKHCQNIYAKFRIHNRAGLVRAVLEHRIASQESEPRPSEATGIAVESLVRKSRAWDKLVRFESILSRSAGVAYFGDMTKALADTFGVKMAGISEVHSDEGLGAIIAYCVDGELLAPFQYELTDSACGVAHSVGELAVFEDLSGRFAGAACRLVEMGFQSYVGVRLDDHLLGPIGTLWIADNKPIDPGVMPMDILKLFAPSVAAELATQIALENAGPGKPDTPGS